MTTIDSDRCIHGAQRSSRNGRDFRVALVVIGCLIPIPFDGAGPALSGTFFLAEFVLAGMAVRAFFRPRTMLSGASLLALCLLLLGLSYFVAGISGETRSALSVVRASFDLFAFCVSIDNFEGVAERLLDALPWVGAVLTFLLQLEFLGYLKWPSSSTVGYIGENLRIFGPIGPGSTATILVCSAYMGLRRKLYVLPLVCLYGIALSGSRAQYIAAAILLLFLSISRFKKYHRYLYLGGAAVSVLFAVYPGFWDRVVAAGDSNTASQRTVLWQQALHRASWLGDGPGGFRYVEPRIGDLAPTIVGYAHNQLLTLMAYYGVVGVLVSVVIVCWLWGRRRHRALFIAIMTSCVFGEFLVGPTPVLALGSMAVWLIFLEDRSADESPAGATDSHQLTYFPVTGLIRLNRATGVERAERGHP